MPYPETIVDEPHKVKRRTFAAILAVFSLVLIAFGGVMSTEASWNDTSGAEASFQVGIHEIEARTPGSNVPSFDTLNGRSINLESLTSGYWAPGDTRTEPLGIRQSNNNDYPSIIPAKAGYMEIDATGDQMLINSLSWEIYSMFSDSRNWNTCTQDNAAQIVRNDDDSVLIASGDSLDEINRHYDIVLADMHNNGNPRNGNARTDLCVIISNSPVSGLPEGEELNVEWQFVTTTDTSEGIN